MLKNIISLAFVKIVVMLLSFFVVVFQARALGPDERGLLAMVVLLPQLFVSVFEGGMRQAATYFLGKELIDRDEALATTSLFYIGSSLISLPILIVAQSLYVGEEVDLWIFSLSILILPIVIYLNLSRGVFLGLNKLSDYSNSILYPKLFQSIIVIALFYSELLTINSAILCFVLMHLINAIQIYKIKRKYELHSNIKNASIDTFKKMFNTGFIYCLSYLFIDLNYKVGIYIASLNLNGGMLGNYVVTTQIVEFIWQIPAAASIVLFSKSSNNKVYDSNWIRTIQLTSKLQFIISLFLSVSSIAILYNFSGMIFGEGYEHLYMILFVLMPGLCFMSVFKVINVDLAGRGYPIYALKFMPIVFIFNFILSYMLSLHFGVLGVSVAASLSNIVATIILVLFYAKLTKSSFLKYFFLSSDDISYLISFIKSKMVRS